MNDFKKMNKKSYLFFLFLLFLLYITYGPHIIVSVTQEHLSFLNDMLTQLGSIIYSAYGMTSLYLGCLLLLSLYGIILLAFENTSAAIKRQSLHTQVLTESYIKKQQPLF